MMKKPCLILSVASIFLCQCSDFDVKDLGRPVQPIPKELNQDQGRQEYHTAYQLVTQARSLRKSSPELAMGRYLDAAKVAFDSREEALLPLYNHAVGQVADLLVDQPQLTSVQGSERKYRLIVPRAKRSASRLGEVSLLDLKGIVPADTLKLKGWRKRVVATGVGAAMVGYYQPTDASRKKEDTFVSKRGIPLPLTVLIDFSKPEVARFSTHDTTVERRAKFWQGSRSLSYDLTAPIAVGLENARKRGLLEDMRGVFYPVRYAKDLGLYSVQKFDRRKTPLVLVHGLVSDPTTWTTTLNGLISDPEITSRYQIYFFYYPTGLPVRQTGSALKKDLLKLQKFYRSMGADASRSVIVGHSMGGLLTSMQVRNFGDDTWRKISKIPLKKAYLAKQVKADYYTLIKQPRPQMINRAVFIATPHRGSKMANAWVGRVVISLIKIPQQALKLDPIKASRSLTDLGRTILLDDDLSNGVQALKNNNPALKLVISTPIANNITYHSIMGDRGKGDTPNSSDGVVEYRSSHLDGAKSEKIVPSGHSAHTNPEAIEELRRILRLNLKTR